MTYGLANNLPRLSNYESAHKYFEGRAKPPRSKKYEHNERPLASVSASHYKIIKGENYYDIKLYSTIMARYFAPDADGGYRKQYMGHNSMTSRAFMWHVLGVSGVNRMPSDKGEVIMPVYGRVCQDIDSVDAAMFSLETYFKDDKLITSKSKHTAHYKFLSSAEDKAARAQTKANLSNFVMLAVMRLPEYHDSVSLDSSLGLPFGQYTFVGGAQEAVRSVIDGNPTQQHVDIFFKIGQTVFDMLASKRGYAQDGFNFSAWRGQKSTIVDLAQPITEKDFETALTKRCLAIVGANKQSERVEIPQFPAEGDYPYKNIHV